MLFENRKGARDPARIARVQGALELPVVKALDGERVQRSLYPLDHHADSRPSELGWIGNFVQPASDPAAPAGTTDAALALNYLKYMAFIPNPPDRFTLAKVRFTDTEFRQLNLLGDAIYNANNPDLHAFAARGGKLILYHGWADQTISPWSTLDYYAAVESATGGFRASQAFSAST